MLVDSIDAHMRSANVKCLLSEPIAVTTAQTRMMRLKSKSSVTVNTLHARSRKAILFTLRRMNRSDRMRTWLPTIVWIAGLLSVALAVIFELTKTPKQEAEMIEREDKVMSTLPDDPTEMATWVP